MYDRKSNNLNIQAPINLNRVKSLNASTTAEKEELRRQYHQRLKIKKFVNSIYYNIALIVCTFYVLFGDDLRHFICNKDTDYIFYIFTLITITFFAFDIVVLFLLYPSYRYGLLFWFDIVSTTTLIFDLGWIVFGITDTNTVSDYGRIARGARSALLAIRATKYIQIIRYIRLIRISNCLKFKNIYWKMIKAVKTETIKAKKTRKTYDFELSQLDGSEIANEQKDVSIYNVFFPDIKNFVKKEEDDNIGNEIFDYMDDTKKHVQNSGIVLSISNTQRVIIIVLILIMFIPVFSIDTYYERQTAYYSGLVYINYIANKQGIADPDFKTVWDTYVNNYNEGEYKLKTLTLYKKIAGSTTGVALNTFTEKLSDESESDIIDSQRSYELLVLNEPLDVVSLPIDSYYVTAIFDKKKVADFNAWLNILRTLFCLLTFFLMALFFTRDANKLILQPMEQMMRTIKRIKANPIQAAKDEEERKILIEEKIKKNSWLRTLHNEQLRYETTLLINTLVQSGKLLAIGLGEAGTEVVIRNLRQDKLNPLIRGCEVICLFGFCDIRGFAEANERLKEDVLGFVNEIANIVHSIIDRFAGCTNKNLGNNFLVVWKFRDSEIEDVIKYDDEGKEKVGKQLKSFSQENNPVTARCELAIISFLTIIASIHQSKSIDKYHKENRKGARKLDTKVVMSFGLHLGWAFEGAIGSEHKIDVSYLSPNVNLASRLEAATKQYGTLLFVSGQVIDLVSHDVRNQHRLVDVVNLKGSKQAIKLYTYDVYTDGLETNEIFEEQINGLEKNQQKLLSIDYRNKLKEFHDKVFSGKFSTKSLLVNNKVIRKMRIKYNREFFRRWEQGFNCYVDGKWPEAKGHFEYTKNFFENAYGIINKEDGPSINLLSYMEDYGFQAPDYWHGVRKLVNK